MLECTPPSETRPDQVHAGAVPSPVNAARRTSLLAIVSVSHGQIDARQVLHHHRAGAEVHVSHLGVAHLPRRQTDGEPAGRQRRVRVAVPELVEDRRARERDCVARAVWRQSPAVQYHQTHDGAGGFVPPARPTGMRAAVRIRRPSARRGDDRRERLGVEARPADQRAVDVRAAPASRPRSRA